MQNKKNFIVTTDKETADKLVLEGFRLLSESNGKFTFEAKTNHMAFGEADKKKIAYTNILSL